MTLFLLQEATWNDMASAAVAFWNGKEMWGEMLSMVMRFASPLAGQALSNWHKQRHMVCPGSIMASCLRILVQDIC